MHSSDYYEISGKLRRSDYDMTLNSRFNDKKKLKINDKKIIRVSDYISKMNVIVFTPDDLNLIKWSPENRRKYLNTEINQLFPKYYNVLKEYNNLLKIRNDYLKKIKYGNNVDLTYLKVVEEYLINKAVFIYRTRKKFIDKINLYSNGIYKETMNLDGFEIKYSTKPSINEFTDENITNILRETFSMNRNLEVNNGSTLYGPSKDDFSFELNDQNLQIIGSQSQQKLSVLVFKLAEIELFNSQTREMPILLLDDVFSELDEIRKNNVMKYLNNNIQTFITTTDLNQIGKEILDNANIINF